MPTHYDRSLLTANLDEALEKPLCPICSLATTAEERHLDMLLYERVNDGHSRELLQQAGGFCAHHTRRLLEIGGYGSHCKIALLYEGLVRVAAEGMEDAATSAASSSRRRTNRHAKDSLSGSPAAPDCPTCRVMAQTEQMYSELLAQLLTQPAWQQRYMASAGLCLRHYEQVYATCRPAAQRFLWQHQKARLTELAADLGEFVRKSVVQNEPFGAERDAWIRVLRLYAGALEG